MHFQPRKSQSAISKTTSIIVSPKITLEQAKEIVYLTKDYYKALKNNTLRPLKHLPDLHTMLLANTIVNAYLQNCNLGLSIKLFNAALPTETVVAVYLFANEKKLNINLGDYQLYAVKHI